MSRFDSTVKMDSLQPEPADGQPVVVQVVYHESMARVGRMVAAGTSANPTILGRPSDAFGPGTLDRPAISRRHVQLLRSKGGVVVEDLGSSNGTYLNGKPVTKAVAKVGDCISLGDVLLLVRHQPSQERLPPPFVGDSDGLEQVLAEVKAVTARDTTVLLLGETGVGKELVARAVHDWSGRRGKFVAVNCGAMSETVLQSELFGHTRGAFTGAGQRRKGLVEEARDGTLFLDEIGDASPHLQVSLLRLLQEGEIRPVGSDEVVHVKVRVVGATHRDLASMVADGTFREDLWTRLARWVIRIPPLRERRSDILPIARAFSAKYGGRNAKLSFPFALKLLCYHWPGNIRELDAVMERAAVRARGSGVLDGSDDPRFDTKPIQAEPQVQAPPVTSKPNRAPHVRPSNEELVAALKTAGGNVNAVARQLGIGRSTIYRWFKDAGIDPNEVR